MEVVVDPDGVDPGLGIGRLRDRGHRLELLDRVLDLGQVELPPLRHKNPELHLRRHVTRLQPRQSAVMIRSVP